MITLRSFLLSLVILISGFHLSAQDRETVTQSTEWFAITSTSKITKNLNLYVEGQFRYSTNFDPLQYQFRIAPEIVLPKNFSVVPIAYVYTWNYKYGEQPASSVNNEHRLWEQVSYKHSVSRFNMSHRLRLEQRFVQDHANEEGDDYSVHANRLRYRFMTNIPLNHQKIEPKTYYISVYDEIFYSWGGPVEYHHPDQNRIFAGLGYQATKLISFQGGFFYQMLIKQPLGLKQENNIGFQLQLNYNFDFTNKEN